MTKHKLAKEAAHEVQADGEDNVNEHRRHDAGGVAVDGPVRNEGKEEEIGHEEQRRVHRVGEKLIFRDKSRFLLIRHESRTSLTPFPSRSAPKAR